MNLDWEELRRRALEVSARAYVPYSRFPVGAAGLVADGRLVTGCNVENAGYGVSLCAECGLISELVATGGGKLLAVCCVNALGEPILPCGRCRQLLWEHGGAELLVQTPRGPLSMAELLPLAFGPQDIDHVTGPR